MAKPLRYAPLTNYPRPSQGDNVYHHAVKLIENINPADLQTNINVFLTALPSANPDFEVFILNIRYQTFLGMGQVASHSVLIHIGFAGQLTGFIVP